MTATQRVVAPAMAVDVTLDADRRPSATFAARMAGNATFGPAGVPSATLTATEARGGDRGDRRRCAHAGEYVRAGECGPRRRIRSAPANTSAPANPARSAAAQAVGWTARAARSWRSKAVGGESRLGAPKWNPWA